MWDGQRTKPVPLKGIRMNDDKTKMMFDLMEYDYLTDAQHDLVISFNEQFEKRGILSDRQFEILEDIFKRASESVEWSR